MGRGFLFFFNRKFSSIHMTRRTILLQACNARAEDYAEYTILHGVIVLIAEHARGQCAHASVHRMLGPSGPDMAQYLR